MLSFAIKNSGRAVVATTFRRVWVYFPDVPATGAECVKQLAVDQGAFSLAGDLRDPRLAYVPVRLVNGVLEFPKSIRISHANALAEYLSKYPKGLRTAFCSIASSVISVKQTNFFKTCWKGKGRNVIHLGDRWSASSEIEEARIRGMMFPLRVYILCGAPPTS